MRDKFICRFQDSSNQSIVLRSICFESIDICLPAKGLPADSTSVRSLLTISKTPAPAFKRWWVITPVCPMTCQPEQDGDICLRSRHQLRPRGIWSNRSGKYSRWSAVPSWNRFSGPAVETNKVTLPLIGRATQVEVWLCSNNIVSRTQWFHTLAMLVWWTRISCLCLFSLTAAGLNICATDKNICAPISQNRRKQKNFVLWTNNEIFAPMLLSNYHGWFSIKK